MEASHGYFLELEPRNSHVAITTSNVDDHNVIIAPRTKTTSRAPSRSQITFPDRHCGTETGYTDTDPW